MVNLSRRSTGSIHVLAIYIPPSSPSSSVSVDLSLAQSSLSEIVHKVHLAAALALWVKKKKSSRLHKHHEVRDGDCLLRCSHSP